MLNTTTREKLRRKKELLELNLPGMYRRELVYLAAALGQYPGKWSDGDICCEGNFETVAAVQETLKTSMREFSKLEQQLIELEQTREILCGEVPDGGAA